jgi:kynurenine formamidase
MPAVTTNRWSKRPPGSNWGDFGTDDQLGRLNLIGPEQLLKAAGEIRLGRAYCLGLPLDYPGGSAINAFRRPPMIEPEILPDGTPALDVAASRHRPGATDVFSDARTQLSLQYSTHWDGLAHVGQMYDANDDDEAEIVYYNGFHPSISRSATGGVGKLGIENMAAACVQGRGVLLDLEAYFGLEDQLVGYDGVMAALAADHVEVENGDFLCIRTGYSRLLMGMNRTPDREVLEKSTVALDGRDARLQNWITDSGIVAIAADNYAVERLPAREGPTQCCASLPLHEHCLFRLGVYLGELWYLSELADALRVLKRSRFFLSATPLRLPGAVASPVTPVAII